MVVWLLIWFALLSLLMPSIWAVCLWLVGCCVVLRFVVVLGDLVVIFGFCLCCVFDVVSCY